jgi:hemerythrin-like metal-binding protein
MSIEKITFRPTGIAAIDEQHAQLVSCLDRLLLLISSGYGLGATFDALDALGAYTRTHFAFEEQHMRDHDYPGLAEHVKLHQAIIGILLELNDDLASAKDVESELVSVLRNWIIKHIDVEDAHYGAFLGVAGH